jgi:hypothetical protein
MGAFLFGFGLGLFAPLGALMFLMWWLCRPANKATAAKFLNGMASVLVDKAKSPPEPPNNGQLLPMASEEGRTWP